MSDEHSPAFYLEEELRSIMWRSHGHTGIYGDDGEMQCSKCAKYGCWDYRNAPMHEVLKAYQMACFERVSKSLEPPGEKVQPMEIGRKMLADLEAQQAMTRDAEPRVTVPEDLRLKTTAEQRVKWRTFSWRGFEAVLHDLLNDIDTLIERLGAAEQREREEKAEIYQLHQLNSALAANLESVATERDRLREQLDTSEQMRFAAEQEIDDTLDAVGATGEKRDLVLSHLVQAKVAELERELALQKGSNSAQEERERTAAERLGMVHTCDWPEEVAERVAELEGRLASAEQNLAGEQDEVFRLQEKMRLHDANVRREALQEAQKALRTEFDDRTDNLMGNIDRVIAALIEGGA